MGGDLTVSLAILKSLGLGDLAGRGWRVHLSFWAMIWTVFFLFADQNLASANLSRIGAEFGMHEKETYRYYLGSVVSAFFFVLGGFFSLTFGALTDRFDRKKLFAIVTIGGEIPCLLTAFAPDYTWFLILRTLTGLGLGGIFPVIFSITGDLFRRENRPTASAWLGLAMGLGIAVGQIMGGVLAHENLWGLSGWRLSFIVMALPSFPLALIYLWLAKIPARGATDVASVTGETAVDTEAPASGFIEPKHSLSLKDFKRVFGTRTNVFAFLQGIPGTIPWGLLFVYAVDFFEVTRGFDVSLGVLLVSVFGGVSIIGGFLGGFIGKWLYNKKKSLFPVFCGLTVAVGSLPVFAMFNYTGDNLVYLITLTVIGALIVPMTGSNVRAILMNVNLPENRGSVFAVFNFTDDLGKGFGPLFIGLFMLALPEMIAYNLAIAMWLLCAVAWIGIVVYMESDEDKVSSVMEERSRR